MFLALYILQPKCSPYTKHIAKKGIQQLVSSLQNPCGVRIINPLASDHLPNYPPYLEALNTVTRVKQCGDYPTIVMN